MRLEDAEGVQYAAVRVCGSISPLKIAIGFVTGWENTDSEQNDMRKHASTWLQASHPPSGMLEPGFAMGFFMIPSKFGEQTCPRRGRWVLA